MQNAKSWPNFHTGGAVADPGGGRGGHGPPGPVKIGHKKDGRRRQLHRFHVSWPPLLGHWIRYWGGLGADGV